jgi:hypothetical protein
MRSIMAAMTLAALCGVAQGSVVFSGSSGSKAGSATFAVEANGDLVVTLVNTSTADVMLPSDILTAVIFNISGSAMSLSRISGVLAPGSVVVYDPDGQPAGGIVGGEWAYNATLTGAPGNRSYGISSSGLGGLFGPGQRFPGDDLEPPTNPDGLQYGLTSAGDNLATGNNGVLNSGGLIKNGVIFRLGGAGANFDLARITDVLFIYGTAIGEGELEGELPPVPTPGAAALLTVGMGLMVTRRRRAAR